VRSPRRLRDRAPARYGRVHDVHRSAAGMISYGSMS
jgi:hypothetical protein